MPCGAALTARLRRSMIIPSRAATRTVSCGDPAARAASLQDVPIRPRTCVGPMDATSCFFVDDLGR